MAIKSIPSPPPGIKKRRASTTFGKQSATKAQPAREAIKPEHCSINVGSKNTVLALAGLDQKAIQDVVAQLEQGKLRTASIELAVDESTAWSPSHRGRFWMLYRAIKANSTRQVTLRASGTAFAEPADWAANLLLAPTDDAAEKCRVLELAADIIANAYLPADRDVYLETIINKFRDRHFSKQHCDEVKRNIRQRLREIAKDADGGTNVDGIDSGRACDLAKVFLTDRYSLTGTKSEPMLHDSNPAADPADPKYNLRYYLKSFFRRRSGVWVETTLEDVKLELTSFLQKCAPDQTGTKQIGDVFINLKALCALRVDHLPPLPFHLSDPERRFLAFRNGLLDLTSLKEGAAPAFLPHDPDWFSTSILPYRFDRKAKCPKFKAFLGQIFNADPKKLTPLVAGDNRVKVVQELLGYSLLPSNQFQKFAIFTGKGANGKGTLFDVWAKMIGSENVSSVPLDAMGKDFGTEPLVGKLLNLAGDMNEINAVMEGTLKSWTGEDRVTVNRKHILALQVEPTVKFVYGCNGLPFFKDKSDGVWRRLIVVPSTFTPQSPEDVDPQLRGKLSSELPGILNLALRGLARLLANQRFTDCNVCEKAKSDHRDACSPVKNFIGNHFTFYAEFEGEKQGKKWTTTASEIATLVKGHNEKYGERIASHIVCKELTSMHGVFSRRPKTTQGRTEFGMIYCGVCIGAPKSFIPHDLDDLAEKTGLTAEELSPAIDPVTAKPPKACK